MVLEMQIPSPGESISEVEIAEWLVVDGEYVEKDQIIAEIDSDKATLELPAEQSGVITLKADEGDVVQVGQVVCHIDTSAKGKASSVQFIHFKFTDEQIRKFISNDTLVELGIDHDEYSHSTKLNDLTVKSLSNDFS